MRASCSSEHGACPRASSRSGRRRAAHGRRRCAAGAIALRARGESAAAAVLLGRGQSPFGEKPPLRLARPPCSTGASVRLSAPASSSTTTLPRRTRPRTRLSSPASASDRRRPPRRSSGGYCPTSPRDRRGRRVRRPRGRRVLAARMRGRAAGAHQRLVPLVNAPRRHRAGRCAMHSPSWSRARLPRRPSTIRGPRCSTKRDTRGVPARARAPNGPARRGRHRADSFLRTRPGAPTCRDAVAASSRAPPVDQRPSG